MFDIKGFETLFADEKFVMLWKQLFNKKEADEN